MPRVSVWVEPVDCGTMHVGSVLDLSDTSMTFDGSFYDAMNGIMFPECVIHRTDTKQFFHVELTSYKQHEDTSTYWTDEEEQGRICLFPSHVITVTWRVLKEIQLAEERDLVREIMKRRKAFRAAWFEADRNRPETPISDDSDTATEENNEHK